MVTTRNDSIELTASTAPPPEERYLNGTTPPEKSRSKRSRKRCWTLVVLVLVAIGAGTMLLYEYLHGWHPAEGNGGLQPEVAQSSFRLPGLGGRDPKMIDPNAEVSSSTTEGIIASSTKGVIFIDSTTEGKSRINGTTEKIASSTNGQTDLDEDYANSDDDDMEQNGSGDGRGDDEASGSGDGAVN